MLSVWWGINGIIHWEILSSGCNMTTDLHCQQLDRVAEKFKEGQDRITLFACQCETPYYKVDP